MRIDEMRVLLTGASGGIGRQLAAMLADAGASLLLAGRNEARLRALCDSLDGSAGRIDCAVADLTDPEERAALVGKAAAFRGGINVLINNAGINRFGTIESQSAGDIEMQVAANVAAPMLLTQSLLPVLRRAPRAVVMNVGSVVGSIGLPGQVPYCAAKFALHGFSEALRRELSGSGVDVLYVAPRSTDTDMNDAELRSMNERAGVTTDPPARVAAEIVRALRRRSRERFIGWPERLFVKVNALMPALVDRSLAKQADWLTETIATQGVRQ